MNRSRAHALALTVLALWSPADAQPSAGYRVPPAPIPQILDAAPVPTAVLAPSGERLVLLHPRAMPSIAELAEPIHRLAGVRFVAASGAPAGGISYAAVSVAGLDGRLARAVSIPADRHPPFAARGLLARRRALRGRGGTCRSRPALARLRLLPRPVRSRACGSTRPLASVTGWPTAPPSSASRHPPRAAPNRLLRPPRPGPTSSRQAGRRLRCAHTRTCSPARTTKRCSRTTRRARFR